MIVPLVERNDHLWYHIETLRVSEVLCERDKTKDSILEDSGASNPDADFSFGVVTNYVSPACEVTCVTRFVGKFWNAEKSTRR